MVRVKGFHFSQEGTKRLTLAAVSLAALAGVVLVLYSTAIAPWAFSDSSAYINTARNIVAGRGIVLQDSNNIYTLLPLHAPLYPLMLSLPAALGMDPLQASRWLNAILFGLAIFLAGWATHRFTRSFWLASSVAGLCLFSYEPLRAFTGAMAEGLFITFGLLSLILVALSIQQPERSNKLLAFSGTSAGLAILARYTGLAVLAAGVLAVLLLDRGNFKTRVKKTVIFAVPGIFLASLWLVPVYFSTHTFGSRQVGEITGIPDKIGGYFTAFFDVIGSWLPFFYRGNHMITPIQKLILGFVVLTALIVAAVIKIKKNGQPIDENGLVTWGLVLGIFSAMYIGLHLTTIIVAAEQPDINGRLLLPLFYTGVLLAAVLIAFISRGISKVWLGGLAFTALALLTLWYFHAKVQLYVFEMHHYGQGYTSNRWNENLIFDQISTLDEGVTVYSNEPALVLFYTGRLTKNLTVDTEHTTYIWPHAGDEVLILFIGTARKDIGENYPGFVESLRSSHQSFYEDNEGMIFIPPQP